MRKLLLLLPILAVAPASCAPVAIDEREVCGAGEVTVIAETEGYPLAIALDAARVYWTIPYTGVIMMASRSGGPPSVFASNLPDAEWLAVDDANVYVLAHPDPMAGAIYALSKAGDTSPKLIANTSTNAFPVLDHQRIYWSGDGMWFVPTSGGTPTLLSQESLGAFAVDGERAYWIDYLPHELFSRPTVDPMPDSAPTHLADLAEFANANVTTVDAERIYYWNGIDIVAMPKTGGDPTALAFETAPVHELLVDTECLFWTTDLAGFEHGKVRAARRGGEVITVADGLASGTPIAADKTGVYWADQVKNAIMKLSR